MGGGGGNDGFSDRASYGGQYNKFNDVKTRSLSRSITEVIGKISKFSNSIDRLSAVALQFYPGDLY